MSNPFRYGLMAGLLAAVTVRLGADATIEGMVELPKLTSGGSAPARYTVNATGHVASPAPPVAVVYLEGEFPAGPATNLTAEVVQEHFQFRPAVLPVRRGATIEFPNRDDAYHNVFSYSKPKRFDLGRYRKDEKPAAVVFDQAGVVKLYCEIHEHMRATILVLDTPHFTRTDTNGVFRLERLPAGRFTLKAWINDKVERERAVELTDGGTLRVDFPNR